LKTVKPAYGVDCNSMARGNPSENYALAVDTVLRFIRDHPETEATVCAYMLARAALLAVRAERSPGHAAQLAYRLADEFAGEGAET
jgi:hypothetical protein